MVAIQNKKMKLLTMTEVMKRTQLRPRQICTKQRNGDFPKNIYLNGKAIRWLESDITNWLESKIN